MRIIFFHHQLNVYHGILLYHEQIRLHTHDKLRSRVHALILPMLTSKAQGPLLLIPRTLIEGRTEILCRIRMPDVYYYI